jgi:hypothetical protein
MSGLDDRELALLLSISDEIARLRNDVKTIQRGLIRIGAIVPKKAESARAAAGWSPPVLKRLGDMVTIIAASNPAAAKALQEAGFDTAQDPGTDPEVDPNGDTDVADGVNVTDPTDPRFRDADRNARNWRPTWLGGDNDPTKKDRRLTRANFADVTDVVPPDTQDDANDVRPRPDTARDAPPETMGW